jgi:glycosyltransferase involved in cell wall biosynthesis
MIDQNHVPREHLGLVSCVIIFYNAKRYLADAIESVFSQTYSDWELVLVDDGSTDGSTEIARRYAKQRPNQVRILTHPGAANLGKSASRNLGMRAARGEFLAMLDADDVWLPEKLEQQVALLRVHPSVDMLYGPVLYWYSWTGRPRDGLMDMSSQVRLPPMVHAQIFEPPTLLTKMIVSEARRHEGSCPYPSCVMLRSKLFQQCNGFDVDFRDVYDDAIFFVKVFLRGRIYVCDQIWTYYRLHSDAPYSGSYTDLIKSGSWHPVKANPSEQKFLERAAEYVNASRNRYPLLQSAGLQATLWYARLRYRRPKVFRLLSSFLRRGRRIIRWARDKSATRSTVNAREHIRRGLIRWGDFNSLQPISGKIGFERRSSSILARITKSFLNQHRSVIQGRVIELGDDSLTREYGGERVRSVTILRPSELFSDDGTNVGPEDTCDCLIAMDAVQYADDPSLVVGNIERRLSPGGTALVILPGLVPMTAIPSDRWRFTPFAVRKLFETAFRPETIEVQLYGNVRLAMATFHGLGEADLDEAAFKHHDDAFPLFVAVVATKSV